MALSRFNPQRPKTDKAARILYVEDEDTNWEVAEFALRRRYHLLRARDARETFAAIKQSELDLILMDIQLSGSDLNGIEITEILKKRYRGTPPSYVPKSLPTDLPVVFVTAYNARYRKEDLLAVGGDDMLVKPVDFTRLSLVMARLLVRKLGG